MISVFNEQKKKKHKRKGLLFFFQRQLFFLFSASALHASSKQHFGFGLFALLVGGRRRECRRGRGRGVQRGLDGVTEHESARACALLRGGRWAGGRRFAYAPCATAACHLNLQQV